MKTGTWLVGFLAPLAATAALAQGSGVPRPDPVADGEIPVSGRPVYVEDLTVGTPVADYGSHMGVKASTRSERAPEDPLHLPARALLNHAQYVASTREGRQMDQAFLDFLDEGEVRRFFPAEERSVAFEPWGWRETATDGGLTATGVVRTLATNAFLIGVVVANDGPAAATLTPRFNLRQDLDPTLEGIYASNSVDDSATAALSGEAVTVRYAAPFVGGLLGINRFSRALLAEPAIAAVQSLGSGNFYNFAIPLGEITAPAGGSAAAYVVLGFGYEDAEALENAEAGRAIVEAFSPDAAEAVLAAAEDADAEWADYYAGLRKPHTEDPSERAVYDLAAAALRMNVYGRRDAMPGRGSVPGKAHFNQFFGWDTPLQAVGHNEIDPAIARENLRLQFAIDDPATFTPLPYIVGEDLRLPRLSFGPNVSQPPVQGFTLGRMIAQGSTDAAFLNDALAWAARYAEWWERDRDPDGNSLYFWQSGLECGWDDTPRLRCPLGPVALICFIAPAFDIEAVDLSAWLYSFYDEFARAAALAGDDGTAGDYAARAEAIRAAMDANLWDEETGAYYDAVLGGGAPEFQRRGLSPAIAFPLFVGATRDPARARRVVEEHLLNPEEFWFDDAEPARFPIPTVAYNDAAYDDLQDGYYWQGQTWMFTNYLVATALYRYGYEAEAETLVRRTLASVRAANPGGIHETYDSRAGVVGWGSGGPGEPSVFQFGWSTALLTELLLDRHQRDRFVLPGEIGFSGYVARAAWVATNRALYEVLDAPTLDVPRVEAFGGSNSLLAVVPPLEDADFLRLAFSDPFGNLAQRTFALRVRPPRGAGVVQVGGAARAAVPATREPDGALVFTAEVGGTYEVGEVSAPGGGGGGDGCGCETVGGAPRPTPFSFAPLALLLFMRARSRRGEVPA